MQADPYCPGEATHTSVKLQLYAAHIHCDEVFGIVGENFTFPVKSGQNITEILWTKNKNKVAEWEGQNETTYYTSLIDRGLLNKKNGYLTIYNLENSDAGTYELTYLDFVKENYAFTFMLSVLPPPSEPEITCNISGDDFVLNCIADFPKPLDYSWKLDSTLVTHHTTEIVIPNKNVDVSKKAVCLIKFSQTERSSEISLSKCFPDEKGDSYQKRNRDALWGASVFFLLPVGITIFLYIKARSKLEKGRASQKSPVHHSGEHTPLYSVENQEQFHLDRTASSQAVDHENEEPEADLKS
ncbi:lymphocyte function-associated antigen 3 isoform X4 [Cuculus canorus]|uniref:lymphocyte function-associated antigen 3 isoform X4 n=1 Tax=Cuculus canorus TaxID=55661 RepID=UPI0023AA3A9B|nr:lymphocyte function-associated antigen 3 isoform X4 [Cuculus canorus]